MIFSTPVFLFVFLPLTIVCYYICNDKLKNLCLVLASLIFYVWGDPSGVVVLLLSVVLNYLLGMLLDKQARVVARRAVLFSSVAFNVGLLLYFKYTDFFVANLNLFGAAIPVKNLILPIGISYFTFKALSYHADIYRKKIAVERNIMQFGLYITMFPAMIAGPIVRYTDLQPQLQSRHVTVEQFAAGFERFALGFIKKVLVADQVSVLANTAFSSAALTAILAWLGALAYMVQIYYDFSGYSDMAIGIGRMFGFELMENFEYPYISKSVKEFWRRWHISLSTWFRDYLYIPLGGSRCSKSRAMLNLLIVFILTGFWHGAQWTFILWGLYYGILLVLERVFLGRVIEKLGTIASRAYTLLAVLGGWIFFRAESIPDIFGYIKALFNFTDESFTDVIINTNAEMLFFLAVGILFSVPLYPWFARKLSGRLTIIRYIIIFAVFILAVFYMTGNGFSPFLYLRF